MLSFVYVLYIVQRESKVREIRIGLLSSKALRVS